MRGARGREINEVVGVAERLKFWGPQTDLAPFYQAATVLALPTIYDPCSNVVLEALACGTPVIAYRHGSVAEVMEEESKPLNLDLDEELEKLRKIKDLLAIESAAASLGRLAGEPYFLPAGALWASSQRLVSSAWTIS